MQTHPNTNIPIVNTRPPSSTRNSATAIAGTATSTRAPRSERRSRPPPRGSERAVRGPVDISGRSSPAKTPPTPGELGQGLFEGLAGEVRPELLAEHQLRVRR